VFGRQIGGVPSGGNLFDGRLRGALMYEYFMEKTMYHVSTVTTCVSKSAALERRSRMSTLEAVCERSNHGPEEKGAVAGRSPKPPSF
jgi:hypothetical protein